jgi:hypothetical protein
MKRSLFPLAIVTVLLAASISGSAWGVRAHTWINRVAVRTIPDDGPVFLKAHEDWIAYLSTIPDTWRRPSEPFLKMLEDPNHGWFKEQFSFMKEIPRSRYEFVLALSDEQRRQAAAGDPAAALTNVRWTGTMPYAAVEGYERMLTGMRRYREMKGRNEDTRFVEQEIAFYMGWTGHYTGDGAQPLHDTIHHDGWQGANPKGYTTNPRVHGEFESRFVDAMELEGKDFESRVGSARVLADPFASILDHLDEAGRHTEQVYRLEQAGALTDPGHAEARALVVQQAARGAGLLRDLAYTAWVKSGEPPANDPGGNPVSQTHPRYNPATGSAPAHVASPPPAVRPSADRPWRPVAFSDPVMAKNFYLFEAIGRTPAVRERLSRMPALQSLRDERVERLRKAAAGCGTDTICHANALKWSGREITAAEAALVEASREEAMVALIEKDLRPSGLLRAHEDENGSGLVAGAWREAAIGLNRIIDVYALGTAPLYPKIDAISYDAQSDSYRRIVATIVAVLDEQRDELSLFYEPTLGFARRLIEANRRDEAGRFEPLHTGENAAGYRRIPGVDWSRYQYSAILVPGAGNDVPGVALSPAARLRLELAVLRYRRGYAPFIIVSGGYVHPNQTPFNEALEMKRSLVLDFGIPSEAVLIEPHARHTTTNLRNAARIVYRYGLPLDKAVLITTDASQSAYISGTAFRDRCTRELGYQPGELGQRLSAFDQEFRPAVDSLHADARDPLDP